MLLKYQKRFDFNRISYDPFRVVMEAVEIGVALVYAITPMIQSDRRKIKIDLLLIVCPKFISCLVSIYFAGKGMMEFL